MRFKATLDRVEDGVAVLLPTQDERSPITLPQGFLPEGAREGHIIQMDLEIDEAATQETRKRVEWLLGELAKRSKGKRAEGPPRKKAK